jgi:hypothetical protein
MMYGVTQLNKFQFISFHFTDDLLRQVTSAKVTINGKEDLIQQETIIIYLSSIYVLNRMAREKQRMTHYSRHLSQIRNTNIPNVITRITI